MIFVGIILTSAGIRLAYEDRCPPVLWGIPTGLGAALVSFGAALAWKVTTS